MVANLMSMLLVGAGKFIVQFYGDISDFAIYSFGVSITGLILTAVIAISLVLYPTIKRAPSNIYNVLFHKINVSTRLMGLLALLLYYPMYIFVAWFYPHYNSVLSYLYVLCLTVFFQCKISLLNNTFYKVMRLETKMLIANLSCVLLFVILAFYFFPKFPQMKTIALCTLGAMMVRSYASEISLSKYLNLEPDKRIILELIIMSVLIVTTECFSIWISAVFYILVVVIWLVMDKDENKVVYELLKK